MFHVIVQLQAKQDIARNAMWWADHHSIDQALLWIDAVESQLQELGENPYRFGFAVENGTFPIELRQILVGLGNRRSYRGIFTIRNDSVYVLAILRAEQQGIGSVDVPSTP
ncbi:MAG: type II toxin-antitoxin system RelE/ParE family toxin [Pirellula sp.]